MPPDIERKDNLHGLPETHAEPAQVGKTGKSTSRLTKILQKCQINRAASTILVKAHVFGLANASQKRGSLTITHTVLDSCPILAEDNSNPG